MDIQANRGRPKDDTLDLKILKATIDLIAQNGYQNLTIEEVTKYAKVGKGAIYRRYKTKNDLVIAAAIKLCPFGNRTNNINVNIPLREQLISLLMLLDTTEHKTYHQALTTIINSIDKESSLLISNNFRDKYTTELLHILQTNNINQENIDFVIDLGPALTSYKSSYNNEYDFENYISKIVDILLLPLLQ